LEDRFFWARRMPDPQRLLSLGTVFPSQPPIQETQDETTLGRLTDTGLAQMRNAGSRLRQVYVEDEALLPHDLTSAADLLNVWSTHPKFIGSHRTVESAQALLDGLFPAEHRSTPGAVRVNVDLPPSLLIPDMPDMQDTQRRLEMSYAESGFLRTLLESRAALQRRLTSVLLPLIDESLRVPDKKHWDERGLQWIWIHDLLACFEASGAMPDVVSMADIHEAGRIAVFFNMHRWNPRIPQLAAGALLARLFRTFTSQNKERMYLYSAHDSTLAALVAAARLDVPLDWPPFASTLCLELREDSEGQFVRWVYNGRVVNVVDIFGQKPRGSHLQRLSIEALPSLYPWLDPKDLAL